VNITLVPKQTESAIRSIRGYGCYYFCLVSMVANKFNHAFTVNELENIFNTAVKQNIILDNTAPTNGSAGPWFRCFVAKPVALIKLIAASIGKEVNPVEVCRVKASQAFDQAMFYIYEYATKYGSHFLSGDNTGNMYNPDPSIGLKSLKTIRSWNL